MSRLIDADALIEFIDAGHLRHPSELCFSELDVVNMLNHAPTAYDVEKVMDQLEENQTIKFHFTGEKPTQTIDYETAIDIVKRGGVE